MGRSSTNAEGLHRSPDAGDDHAVQGNASGRETGPKNKASQFGLRHTNVNAGSRVISGGNEPW